MGTMAGKALDSPNFPRETEAQRDKGHVHGQEAGTAARAAVPGLEQASGTSSRQAGRGSWGSVVGTGWVRTLGAAGEDRADGDGQAGAHSGGDRPQTGGRGTEGGDGPQTGELSQTW